MKLDVTPAQLKAIKDMADDLQSFHDGHCEPETDKAMAHQIRMVDAMLKRNNLPPRDFN